MDKHSPDCCGELQVHERNSGRDPFPVFLKRGPLPREKPRGATLTGRIPKSLCYRPCDFRLGDYVNVHGRDFLLHDCDAFTREYCMVSWTYKQQQQSVVAWTHARTPNNMQPGSCRGVLPIQAPFSGFVSFEVGDGRFMLC
jgi:hypothetical protein